MANYIAIVHKNPDSDFGVSFPDFPGCVTAGQNIDEAKDMAEEAITLHIHGMFEDGRAVIHINDANIEHHVSGLPGEAMVIRTDVQVVCCNSFTIKRLCNLQ